MFLIPTFSRSLSYKIESRDGALNQVTCSYVAITDPFMLAPKTCYIWYQKIDAEGFTIDADLDPETKILNINERQVEYLPENVAEVFPRLVQYKAINCQFKIVNEKHFANLNEIEKLDLTDNAIGTIASASFKDLRKLKVLKLSKNLIRTVDPKWFDSTQNLQELKLSDNAIDILDSNCFKNLRNLRKIYLKSNFLTSIPEDLFIHNFRLESIDFEDNKIDTISPTVFYHLNELKKLDLKENVCINRSFSHTKPSTIKKDLEKKCGIKKDV